MRWNDHPATLPTLLTTQIFSPGWHWNPIPGRMEIHNITSGAQRVKCRITLPVPNWSKKRQTQKIAAQEDEKGVSQPPAQLYHGMMFLFSSTEIQNTREYKEKTITNRLVYFINTYLRELQLPKQSAYDWQNIYWIKQDAFGTSKTIEMRGKRMKWGSEWNYLMAKLSKIHKAQDPLNVIFAHFLAIHFALSWA